MGAKETKQICPPGEELVTLEAGLDTLDFEIYFFAEDKLHFLEVMTLFYNFICY